MSQSLTRAQAILLGLVVVLALILSGVGLAKIASRNGLWNSTVEIAVGFSEVHDLHPGTPVRIRGVDAGQIVGIDYPEKDGPGSLVTVRMRVDRALAERLYGNATAQIQATGLLGSKVIAIQPGSPESGPLTSGRLQGKESVDLAQAAAKLETVAEQIAAAADEARQLVQEIRTAEGTLAKLVKEDQLYRELRGLATDGRQVLARADKAIDSVQSEVGQVRTLVEDGRETLRSVRQGTDAVQRLPIIRGYVEDPVALLSRPECQREEVTFEPGQLFEPGTAILTTTGKTHLSETARWLRTIPDGEVVVVCQADPKLPGLTAAMAEELTRKQSEVAVDFLKQQGAHRTGWISRRKLTALGLGFGPQPVSRQDALPASYLQVVLFRPNSK